MLGRELLIKAAKKIAPTELLLQIRWECVLRFRSFFATFSPRQHAKLADLSANERGLLVNLGCGQLPSGGFLNIDGRSSSADLIQYLGRKLDLPDSCAAAVFSEHVLEHLEFPDYSRTFLTEAFRILKPNGYLRLIVPDAGKLLCAFANGDYETLRKMAPRGETPMEAINIVFRERGFHRFAWDYETLRKELEQVGFECIRKAGFRDSAVSELNIDLDQPERIAQSLYVEARKPGSQ